MGTAAKNVARVGLAVSTFGGSELAYAGVKELRNATKIPDINFPAVTAPTPMPIPGQDNMAAIQTRRTSIAAQLARRGRLSTILSQPQSEPLGGAT